MTLSPQLKGVGLMLAGVAFLSANDAVSKYLAERYPLGEVIFLRQLAGFLFVLPYALSTQGVSAFRVVDVAGQIWRALAFLATAVLMVASLAHLPLAIATAIAFSSPLWVAALAGPFLGETVTARRVLAIGIGFAGVLIIMRPGGPSFTWLLLLPVATALANAVRDMLTRKLSRTETPMSILVWGGLLALVASAATLPFAWQPLRPVDWAWMLLAGALNMAAHLTMIAAFRFADASALAPFRYSSLVWAIALGFLVWGHLPDAWSMVGTAVIVAAGVVAVERSGGRAFSARAPGGHS